MKYFYQPLKNLPSSLKTIVVSENFDFDDKKIKIQKFYKAYGKNECDCCNCVRDLAYDFY